MLTVQGTELSLFRKGDWTASCFECQFGVQLQDGIKNTLMSLLNHRHVIAFKLYHIIGWICFGIWLKYYLFFIFLRITRWNKGKTSPREGAYKAVLACAFSCMHRIVIVFHHLDKCFKTSGYGPLSNPSCYRKSSETGKISRYLGSITVACKHITNLKKIRICCYSTPAYT